MANVEVVIARKVGETEALYGSVTTADITEALAAKGFEIDRRKLQLVEPIKRLGEYDVVLKLHRDVTTHRESESRRRRHSKKGKRQKQKAEAEGEVKSDTSKAQGNSEGFACTSAFLFAFLSFAVAFCYFAFCLLHVLRATLSLFSFACRLTRPCPKLSR